MDPPPSPLTQSLRAKFTLLSPIQVTSVDISGPFMTGPRGYELWGVLLSAIVTENVILYAKFEDGNPLAVLNNSSHTSSSTYDTYITLSPGTYNDIYILPHSDYLGNEGVNGGHTGIFQITNGQDGSGPVVYTSQESVHFHWTLV